MSSSEMGPAVMPSGECLQRSWYSWKRRRVERGEDIVLWGGGVVCRGKWGSGGGFEIGGVGGLFGMHSWRW